MDTISRRDYFIGQALAGVVGKYGVPTFRMKTMTARLDMVVALADAIIARLDGEKESNKLN